MAEGPWTTQITHDHVVLRFAAFDNPLKYGIRKPWNIKVNGTEAMTVRWRI